MVADRQQQHDGRAGSDEDQHPATGFDRWHSRALQSEETPVEHLVRGGTQFNGLALTRELARHGHDVTVVNRGKTPVDLPLGVKRRFADRTDAAALASALANDEWDVVYDVNAYRPEDVRTMAELLRGRVGHYVFISSTVIYAASDRLPIHEDFPLERSPQQNEYGRLKIECENFLVHELRERGFPGTTVPLSMGFGPNNILPDREQRMFARLLQGRPILIPGDGSTLAQIGHVDDQARAVRMLGGKSVTFARRYNLTGADYFSADGYFDTFAAVVGVKPEKVYVPAALMDDLCQTCWFCQFPHRKPSRRYHSRPAGLGMAATGACLGRAVCSDLATGSAAG